MKGPYRLTSLNKTFFLPVFNIPQRNRLRIFVKYAAKPLALVRNQNSKISFPNKSQAFFEWVV